MVARGRRDGRFGGVREAPLTTLPRELSGTYESSALMQGLVKRLEVGDPLADDRREGIPLGFEIGRIGEADLGTVLA